MQNVLSAILTLGIGREKLLIPLDRNAAVAVDIAATKPQIEMAPVVVVSDRSQHPRFHLHPMHDPAPTGSILAESPQPENCRPFCRRPLRQQTLTHGCRNLTKAFFVVSDDFV